MSLRNRGGPSGHSQCSVPGDRAHPAACKPASRIRPGPTAASLLPPDRHRKGRHRRHAKGIKGLFTLEGHTSPSRGRCHPDDSTRPERRVRAVSPAPALLVAARPVRPALTVQQRSHARQDTGHTCLCTHNVSDGREMQAAT